MEVDKGKGVAEEARKEVADGDTITLRSSDGKAFEVSKEAARLSKVLAGMIDGRSYAGGIDLNTIGSEALEKVIDYFNKHRNDPIPSAALGSSSSSFNTAPFKEPEKWDRKLVDGLSHDAFFNLLDAADFLSIDGLVDVTCYKIADMMKGKTPAQIRQKFNIKNDYTEEELEEVLQEHAWAFDDKELSGPLHGFTLR